MDRNQWLTTAREAAGFRTDMDLARAAGALKPSGQSRIAAWRQGHRPRWSCIPGLAQALGVQVEEVVAHLWGERPGDPCPCGCGGIEVLPGSGEPQAQTLRIKRTCCGCDNEKVYDPNKARRDHKTLCAVCSKTRQRSERWKFPCVGYRDHGVLRHAKMCGHSKTLTAPYVLRILAHRNGPAAGRQWGRGKFRIPTPLPNFALKADTNVANLRPEDVEWRCSRCLLGARAVLVTEARLKAAGARERIYSGRQRREMLPSFLTGFPKGLQDKGQRLSAEKRRRQGLSQKGRLGLARGKIVAWWTREQLPAVIVYRCAFCGKWNFIREALARRPEYALRGHQRCFLDWQASPEGQAYYERRRRGLPARAPWERVGPGRREAADRRREFAWAIQRHIGGASLRKIAARCLVSRGDVEYGIDVIMRDLPAPEFLSKEFRRHVEMLVAASSLKAPA